jgi:hypothetical protein
VEVVRYVSIREEKINAKTVEVLDLRVRIKINTMIIIMILMLMMTMLRVVAVVVLAVVAEVLVYLSEQKGTS